MILPIKPNVLYSGLDKSERHFFICCNRKGENRIYFKKNDQIRCVVVEHIRHLDPDKLDEVMEFRDFRSVSPFVRRYYSN